MKWQNYAILGMIIQGIVVFLVKLVLPFSERYSLLLMQYFGAFICASIYILCKKSWKKMDKKEIILSLTCGAFSFSGVASFYMALNETAVSIAAPVRGAGFLILTSAIGIIFLKEKISLKKITGLALAAIGIIFLTL
jgi:drug/metabolite transporter (DMT)-like permease